MEESKKIGKPKINLRFLFLVCNDVEAIRHFYVDLLGLHLGNFLNQKDFGWVSLASEGFDMMFFRCEKELPVMGKFSCQPGWEGGKLEIASWAIEIPTENFRDVYHRLLNEETVKFFKDVPEWRQDSYWGISVLDPMGNTVEVYTTPKDKPPSTFWK